VAVAAALDFASNICSNLLTKYIFYFIFPGLFSFLRWLFFNLFSCFTLFCCIFHFAPFSYCHCNDVAVVVVAAAVAVGVCVAVGFTIVVGTL